MYDTKRDRSSSTSNRNRDLFRKSEFREQFQCRCLQEGRRTLVHYFQWIFRRTPWLERNDSKYRKCNSTNSLPFYFLVLEDKIQKPSAYLFWFSIGGHVTDQRSGDGRFIWMNWNPRDWLRERIFQILRCWMREFASALNKIPEFPVQEEGQSEGAENPVRGPVSTRKTDRLHDLWLLSSDWRSWYSTGLRRFVLRNSSWR